MSLVVSKQKGSGQFSKILSSKDNLGCGVPFCNIGWHHKRHGRNIGCLDKVLGIFYFVVQCLRTHALNSC